MAAPVLNNYEWQFGDTGPVMGGGLVFDVQKVDGLDSPPVRVIQQDRDGAHGEFVHAQFYQARTISIEGFIKLPNDEPTPEAYMDTINAAFAPTTAPQPFYYKTKGIDQRVIFAHAIRVAYVWDEGFNYSYIPFQAQLLAPDPRKYSNGSGSVGPVGLASTSGGRAYPKSYAKTYGTVSTGGTFTATNSGNIETYPILTINGAVNTPIVTNITTGASMKFNISLSTADQLQVDCADRIIYLNGTDRTDVLDGTQFIALAPGANYLSFTANSFTTTGTILGQWRSAWR
jgi:phage-related protein